MSEYQPSHSVVSRNWGWGDPEHNEIIRTVFEAATEHADEARFLVDRDLLQREAADEAALKRLDSTFERHSYNSETLHRCQDLTAALDALEALMDPRTIHAHVAVRRLVLVNDGEDVLEYGPEHSKLTLSEEAAPGVVDHVAAAIESLPAVLVPLHPLAEWEYNGERYSIGRMICRSRDRTFISSEQCAALPSAFDPDKDTLTIYLIWNANDGGTLRRTLSVVAGALGIRRPKQLKFESAEDFKAACDALEVLFEGLNGERGAVP